jgi:hypothetical protein
MAAIVKLPSGSWRAQVRRKGKYLTGTFLRKKDAEEWGLEIERNIDRGVLPNSPDPKSVCQNYRSSYHGPSRSGQAYPAIKGSRT